MQQVRIVALLSGRDAKVLEPVVRIIGWVQPGAPAFVAERRIDDCKVKRLQTVAVFELRIGDRVALDDQGGCLVMQNHVHASQTSRGRILVMPGVRVPASSRPMGRLPLSAYRDRPLKVWSLSTVAPV